MMILIFATFGCTIQKLKKERHHEVFEILKFYDFITERNLPKLDLKNKKSILKVNSKIPNLSYLVNVDSSLTHYFNQSKFFEDQGYGIIEYLEKDYICCDFYVSGYEKGDNLHSIYGDRKFANVYLLKDHLEDNPNDNQLDWLAVFTHELTHLTQYCKKPDSIPDMFNLIIKFEEDSLFSKMIHEENEKLLKAINAIRNGEYSHCNNFIHEYLDLRHRRENLFGNEITRYESFYELIEGHARYVEYLGKMEAAKYFKNNELSYNLENEKWMYDTKIGNSYFYSSGFNKIRLLVLKNDYKFVESIIGNSNKTLNDYLELK
ncbi:MAG: hypothetical protein IPO37_01195 [Saprospiraceae bacterium]|nr:hypothetical protein [Saprospiraceae bacterium]